MSLMYCAIREAAEDAGVEYLTDLTITLPIAHIEWDEGPVLSCDDPGELLDRLEAAEAAADEHDQCPAQCPVCGDWATRTPCDHCKGSGCGPGTAVALTMATGSPTPARPSEQSTRSGDE